MWSKEWPKIPGYYWFFGWCWESESGQFGYHLVKVARTSNSLCYITDGHFMYKKEGCNGFWKKANLPTAPNIKLVKDTHSKILYDIA